MHLRITLPGQATGEVCGVFTEAYKVTGVIIIGSVCISMIMIF